MNAEQEKARRRAQYLKNRQNPEWVKRTRAKNLKYAKRRYKTSPAHRAKVLAYCKTRYNAPGAREKRRAYLRKLNYRITPDHYAALLARQGGRCAICRGAEPGAGRDWHVDHCHETGLVRGLLCVHCNLGLGHFKD